MAAFTTMAIVGAAVVGAASTVHSVNQQKKAAKAQAAAIKKQETAALERASLDAARDETGADIKLGRGTASTVASGGSDDGAATSRGGSVTGRVGGISESGMAVGLSGQGKKNRASKRVGL